MVSTITSSQALSETRTEMRDRFTFAAPFPVLGRLAERLFLRGYMERFLRHRNQILKQVAESERMGRLPAKPRQRSSTRKKLSRFTSRRLHHI